MNMCILCKLVGAQPPDPVLIQALENKGQELQGDLPPRFPYAQRFVVFLRLLIIIFCPCWARRKVKVQPNSIYKLDEQGKTTFIIPEQLEEGKIDTQILVEYPDLQSRTKIKPTSSKGSETLQNIEDEEEDDEDDEEKDEEEEEPVELEAGEQNKEKSKGGIVATIQKARQARSAAAMARKIQKKIHRHERYQKKLEISRVKEMEKNPNILNFPPELVYKAINHPKFKK